MYSTSKGINIARQAGYLKKKYTAFTVDLSKSGTLIVKGVLRPTARSCFYSFKMTYQIGFRPRVYLLDPPLQRNENNERPPHLYNDWSLCLYLPGTGQFRGSNSIWTKCIAKHLPLIASSSHSTHFHQNQRSIFLAC